MRYRAYALSLDQRETLQNLAQCAPPNLALRCRLILKCSEGIRTEEIAAELGISPQTVRKWRRRYRQAGIVGLGDRPRPGRPARFPPDVLERLIKQLLAQPLPAGERWSVRRIAKEVGLSPATIGRVWKSMGTGGNVK